MDPGYMQQVENFNWKKSKVCCGFIAVMWLANNNVKDLIVYCMHLHMLLHVCCMQFALWNIFFLSVTILIFWVFAEYSIKSLLYPNCCITSCTKYLGKSTSPMMTLMSVACGPFNSHVLNKKKSEAGCSSASVHLWGAIFSASCKNV